jgi:hypothetical protein
LDFIIPTFGYYIYSPLAVKVEIRTNITTSKRYSVYKVLPNSILGYIYYVSAIYNTSEEHTCAILAPLNNPLDIVITLPREALHEVTINGKMTDQITTNVTVPLGQAAKLSSPSSLRHIVIQSTNNQFSVICVDEHDRYQLKPSSHCGNNFTVLCPRGTYCFISVTCVSSCQNSLTLSTSTGYRRQLIHSDFFTYNLNLESNLDIDFNLRSVHKICVLLTKVLHRRGVITSEVEMITSLETHFMTSADPRSTNFESLYTEEIQTAGQSNPITDVTSSASHTSLPIRTMNPSTPTADFSIQTTSSTEPTTHSSSQTTSASARSLRPSTESQKLPEFIYSRSSVAFHNKPSNSPEQTNYRATSSIQMNKSHSTLNEWSKLEITTKTQQTTFRHNKSVITSNTSDFQSYKPSHLYTSTSPPDNFTTKDKCKCYPAEYCIRLQRSTPNFSTLEEKLKHLHSSLMVNKTHLNSFLRQKSCAKDERPSARNLGYVGAIVISLCFGSIVICDMITLFEKRHRRTSN